MKQVYRHTWHRRRCKLAIATDFTYFLSSSRSLAHCHKPKYFDLTMCIKLFTQLKVAAHSSHASIQTVQPSDFPELSPKHFAWGAAEGNIFAGSNDWIHFWPKCHEVLAVNYQSSCRLFLSSQVVPCEASWSRQNLKPQCFYLVSHFAVIMSFTVFLLFQSGMCSTEFLN